MEKKYMIGNNISYILPYRINTTEQLYNVISEVGRRIENSVVGLEKNINKILGCYQ